MHVCSLEQSQRHGQLERGRTKTRFSRELHHSPACIGPFGTSLAQEFCAAASRPDKMCSSGYQVTSRTLVENAVTAIDKVVAANATNKTLICDGIERPECRRGIFLRTPKERGSCVRPRPSATASPGFGWTIRRS